MKPALFLLLSLISAPAFAAESYAIGKLSTYVESSDSWTETSDTCSVTVKNPRTERDGVEWVRFDVSVEGFPKGEDDYVVGHASHDWDDYGTGTLIFMSSAGEANMKIQLRTLEETLAGKITPTELVLGKTTPTGGYYGGRRYKWRYRCVFL